MNRHAVIFIFLAFTINNVSRAQQREAALYADLLFGHAWGTAGGLSSGVGFHYQKSNLLLSFRYVSAFKLRTEILSPWVPIPIPSQKSSTNDLGLMAGGRWLLPNKAVTASAGLGRLSFAQGPSVFDSVQKVQHRSYFSVPFETSFVWTNRDRKTTVQTELLGSRRRRFLIQVGFKFFGSFSHYSYAGIGITAGMGSLLR